MFSITSEPILAHFPADSRAGGFVTFQGRVRDHADGRSVLRLEYEAYEPLAIVEGEALLTEARERFGLVDAAVIHRVGSLVVGDIAVSIQVSAPHRREAFAGCEWIIDQLKIRVPIWKRETYTDGDSGWVGSDAAPANEEFTDAFLARQIALEEVGPDGQAKLLAARVLLVGAGGLGAASLPYLVGAGIGTIGLVDADTVDVSNLHRQVIYQAQDAGRSKVERASVFAKRLRPGVQIETYPVLVDERNVDTLVAAYDWIVDGTDSLNLKFLLNAACRRQGKPLVTASVHRFEGQILTITSGSPCLNCLFPEPPPEACVGTCAETGILGVVPGCLGILQANEVLKGILGFGELLENRLLLVDLRTGETTSLMRTARPGCPGCAGHTAMSPDTLELTSLAEAGRTLGEYTLVDIREDGMNPPLHLPHLCRPGGALEEGDFALPVVLLCSRGVRSYRLVTELRGQGRVHVYSLTGGLEGLLDAGNQ